MKETVKTRPSREYGVLQHSAILRTGREGEEGERGWRVKDGYKTRHIKTPKLELHGCKNPHSSQAAV